MEITLLLRSDATFTEGDGIAGLLDAEVCYDRNTGLPGIRGSVVRGLLVEECADLLFSLGAGGGALPGWAMAAAAALFGGPGSTLHAEGILRVGRATLPADLVRAVTAGIAAGRFTPEEILGSLTTLRRQTAVNEETGAPDDSTLRTERAVLRQTEFRAPLRFARPPRPEEVELLAACASRVRRGGLGRNRGRGLLCVRLDQDAARGFFARLEAENPA